MEGPGSFAALAAIIMAGLMGITFFTIPIFAMWSYHRRKMEEIRARGKSQISEETRLAIAALREEFASLRDTTTQYDMSFDTALRRLESRIGSVEQRMGAIEQETQPTRIGA